MKRIILFPILILSAGSLLGQKIEPTLFEVAKNFKRIYVEELEECFIAFDMGKHLDKAGVGSSITMTDTLKIQDDKSYKGSSFKVELKDRQLYISSVTNKKSKVYKLEKVNDIQKAKYNLNNAYYLDSYFAMSGRLNQKFQLSHHSFRNGFKAWENLDNKQIGHLQFRDFTDRVMQQTEDSITSKQYYYTTLTNYIIDNIKNLNYPEFKDSISELPSEFGYQGSYFKTVVNQISKSKPDYVVDLYKDDPVNRTLIEFAVKNDKLLLKKLKIVRSREATALKTK